jgi:N-acetylmuramoyl-L-alanine amidase
VKFYRLLPGVLSFFLLSSAAEAARLDSWRFDANRNQLHFTTSGDVQPKAQLIFNPTRLVIDLPGTSLGTPLLRQAASGGIKSIEVAQLNNQITRIVVELDEGYTLNPQQVQFKPLSASQWTVQLPTLERSSPSIKRNNSPNRPLDWLRADVVLEEIELTSDGFLIRTRGGEPDIAIEQSLFGNYTTIEIKDASISPNMSGRDVLVNRHGVSRMLVSQVQNNGTPVVRVRLQMLDRQVDWQLSSSNSGGVLLAPKKVAANDGGVSLLDSIRNRANSRELATIKSIDLDPYGRELLLEADGPLTYTGDWDASSGAYKLVIPNSQLANGLMPPQLAANDPLSWIRVRPENGNTAILIKPASNISIGQVQQRSSQTLALELQTAGSLLNRQRTSEPFPWPSRTNAPTSTRPFPWPSRTNSEPVLRNPNGRIVVAIDPGHGGRDPGAVGIGGLREKDIVMPISQEVARRLEAAGIDAVLTRNHDWEVDLQPRVDVAERVDATVFVSIHANAIDMSRPDVNGIETYYYETGTGLARSIHNSVLRATGGPDRGVRQARFYVLRNSSMPAVLVEVGFVTGAEDAPKLANSAYRSLLAEAIARGILEYLGRY